MEQWGRNLPAESESLEGLIADQRNARLFDIHLELMFGGTRYSFPTDWGIALRGRIRCRSGQRRNRDGRPQTRQRSEEHTSELQSLMRISYAVFCLKKKKNNIYFKYHKHIQDNTQNY